jgi:hypothetical protein
MIEAASTRMAGLLDGLSLAAQIDGPLRPRPARARHPPLAHWPWGSSAGIVRISGEGDDHHRYREIDRGVSALAGGAQQRFAEVDVVVRCRDRVSPITDSSGPVVLGRGADLGAAVAVLLIEFLGGPSIDDGTLTITLAG